MKVSSGQISLTVPDQVLVADNAAFDGFLPEKMTPLLVASQDKFKFSHIIAGASALSRGLLPRVAAKLDVSPISDIIGVKDENTFVRTIYAGNAILTLQSSDPVKVRPTFSDQTTSISLSLCR